MTIPGKEIPRMATPAIEFLAVTKTYRKPLGGQLIPALSDVSFSVLPGDVCAFLGPNGAGKTTSISILMGFLRADSGEIRVLDFAPGDVRAKQHIGFLPENFAFYKYLNARKLMKFHAALAGVKAPVADRLVPDILNQVKLSGYENIKIPKYSRGMVQRLGIAQALLGDPQLLILDDPTSGLDPAGRTGCARPDSFAQACRENHFSEFSYSFRSGTDLRSRGHSRSWPLAS